MGLRRGSSACLAALLILASCKWDQDEGYTPETIGAVLFSYDSVSGSASLTRVVDQTITPNWERELGIEPGKVGDLAPAKDFGLWVTDPAANRVIWVHPENETIGYTIGTDNFSPVYVCEGDKHLLLSDTLTGQAWLVRIRDREATPLVVSGRPGRAIYQSRKFFLVVNDSAIAVISEDARAQAGITPIPARVDYLDWDGTFSAAAFFRQAGQLFQQRINYNINAADGGPQRIAASHYRYSPYQTATYGLEWTDPLFLRNDTLLPWGIHPTRAFFPDFFASQAWVISDSVRRFTASGSQIGQALSIPGEVMRAVPVRRSAWGYRF